MNKYAYVVAANCRYLPGLNAVLNSLDYVKNEYPVFVIEHKLPEKYINEITSKVSYPIYFNKAKQEEIDKFGEAEVLMRKRYAFPFDIDFGTYDAFCILDADMFFAHNVEGYLEIAAKTGLVLGNTLEQKRRYGDKNHQYPVGSGDYIIDPDFWNGRDLACAPLFVGKEWYRALLKSWEIFAQEDPEKRFKAPDMDALNICLLEAGSYSRTIPLSQHTWTGLHECFMKAHTRAIEMHGELFTEDGEEINVVHGQWWNKTWRTWQIENQIGMIDREFNGSESYKVRSHGSFQNVLNWYKKMSVQHKVNINDYLEFCDSHSKASDVMEIT